METTEVLMADLELLESALRISRSHLEAVDLSNAYKNVSSVQYGPLTVLVQDAQRRALSLIEEAKRGETE